MSELEPKLKTPTLSEKVAVVDLFVKAVGANVLWGYRDHKALVYFGPRPLTFLPDELDRIESSGWLWTGNSWSLSLVEPSVVKKVPTPRGIAPPPPPALEPAPAI